MAVTKVSNFDHWQRAAYWRLSDCISGQQIKDVDEIIEKMEITLLIQFQYMQIYNVVKLSLSQNLVLRQLSKFEVIVTSGVMPK